MIELFVKVRFLWYTLNKNMGRSHDTALFNAKIVSYFLVFLFFFQIVMVLDLIFRVGILDFLYHLIPGSTFFERRIYFISFCFLGILIIRLLLKKLYGKDIPIQVRFDRYLKGEHLISKSSKIGLIIFVVYLFVSPILILGLNFLFA